MQKLTWKLKKQEAFTERKKEIAYSISSNESEEDSTYLSYNKVIGIVWTEIYICV